MQINALIGYWWLLRGLGFKTDRLETVCIVEVALLEKQVHLVKKTLNLL